MRAYALVISMPLAMALSCSSSGWWWWWWHGSHWTGVRRPADVVAVPCIFICRSKVHMIATGEMLRRLVDLWRGSGCRGSSCRRNFGLSPRWHHCQGSRRPASVPRLRALLAQPKRCRIRVCSSRYRNMTGGCPGSAWSRWSSGQASSSGRRRPPPVHGTGTRARSS